jgi:hypothetical protein
MYATKRIIGILTAAALTLSLAPVTAPVFAAETDGLEAAILAAKRLIDVPAEMDEFNYAHYTSGIEDADGSPYVTYSLNWSGDYGAVSAEVADGKLLSFYRYDMGQEQIKDSAAVSRDDARKTAESFLAAADKELAAKMELVKTTNVVNARAYGFSFVMKENGIPADFVTAQIDVDKYTGELANYYWNGIFEKPDLPDGKSSISKEEAAEAFLAADGVRPEYRAWYDRENKKRFVMPVYALKSRYLAIDAATGESITTGADFPVFVGMRTANAEDAKADDEGAPQLTEAEIAALDTLGGLLTADEARAALIRLFPDARNGNVSSESIRRDPFDETRYTWSFRFEKELAAGEVGVRTYADASVDAKTGEVLTWHYSENAPNAGSPRVSYDSALKTASDFVEKNTRAGRTLRLSEEDEERIDYYRTTEDEIYNYSFGFDRYENDVIFRDNGVNIVVDARTGKIMNYNCNWFENIDIPPAGERGWANERDTAFNLYDFNSEFGLKYTKVYPSDGGKAFTVLVWHWTAPEGYNYIIDGESFERLGNDGKRYVNVSEMSYDDITGHWVEAVVNELLENGYYINGDSFVPGERITQEVFLHYLYSPEQSYYGSRDEFYRMLANNGVVKPEERAPDAEISRYDAAKFVIRHIGQQRVAEHPEVFTNVFNDNVAEEYRGYVAVAKALSIIGGDSTGNFNGGRILTRAEAAVVILNALKAR